MLTYKEALAFLDTVRQRRVPVGLEPVRALLHALGEPQEAFLALHIAGTNGKGSVAAMLESVLRCAGCKTGLFTSPYLYDMTERIRIDGRCVEQNRLAALVDEVRQAELRAEVTVGYFAFFTAMCFLYFQQQRVKVAVVEVGLGGRLDPTNTLIAPEAAIITHIGLDHTRILGDTVQSIAAEKASIIKYHTPVVLQAQEQAVQAVIARIAAGRNAPLHISPNLPSGLERGRVYVEYGKERLYLGVSGAYQAQNAATVIKTVELLRERGWRITDAALADGLAQAQWGGRFELLGTPDHIPLLFDGAHNPQGMQALIDSLSLYYPGQPVLYVLAMMRDKDAPACIRLLAAEAKAIIAAGLAEERALPAAALHQSVQEETRAAYWAQDVNAAIALARSLAAPGDVICVCGSLHMRAYIQKT